MNTETEREELAVITDVHVGRRDAPAPVLWFTAHHLHGDALQVFPLQGDEAMEILRSVYDCKELEGAVCVVTITGHSMRFVRLFDGRKLAS